MTDEEESKARSNDTPAPVSEVTQETYSHMRGRASVGMMGLDFPVGSLAKFSKPCGNFNQCEFLGFYRIGQTTGRPSLQTPAGNMVKRLEAKYLREGNGLAKRLNKLVVKHNLIIEVSRMHSDGKRTDQIAKCFGMTIRNVQLIIKKIKRKKLKP